MEKPWALNHQRILSELKTDFHLGLSEQTARRRLQAHGANVLTEAERTTGFQVLLRQFQSPMTLILLAAAVLSYFQGEPVDTLVVGVVALFNVSIGFFQEYKAERTIAALRHALAASARVIRDGIEQKIPAHQLVPGDILVIEAGDRVPADARILEAKNLRSNEAALTGETVPSHKSAGVIRGETILAERSNMLYMSTLVVDGRALAVVTATGMGTEIGTISREVAHVKPLPTVLQRKMTRLGRLLLIVAFILAALVLLYGLAKQVPFDEMAAVALSLLVSIVPEGLPVAFTVVLSVGLVRMYRRHTLIRKLSGAETLGSATVICVDKTGTLTEAKMMVEKILLDGRELTVTGRGYNLSGDFLEDDKRLSLRTVPAAELILQLASLATVSTISEDDLKNDQAKELTDPTETAMAVVAAKAGYYAFKQEKQTPEVLEVPFDQELRYSISVHRVGAHHRYIVKGAPEQVLGLATSYLTASGQRRRLLRSRRTEFEDLASTYATRGYRLVAIGYADRPRRETPGRKHLQHVTFVGFFCIADPIRADVRPAIAKATQAGLRVIMLTGDHLLTAETIAAKIGLTGQAIHARDLRHHSLDQVSVIARATPSDKLKIIEKLQKQGEVVAMTGDGVNDAPALKKADIGIAMGRSGTDVAIEAAEMVLLKDNFAAIIEAVEQGRLIWENLRKVLFYLTATTITEVLIILVALFAELPLPLLPVQILWMNLITDGIMSMALTVEPAEEDLMRRPPRPVTSGLVDASTARRMALLSLVMMAGTLLIYTQTLDRGVDYARTAALSAMVFFQLLNIFNARSHTRSIFQLRSRNSVLTASLLIAFGVYVVALYLPGLSALLGIVALDWPTLLVIFAISSVIILADELRKLARRLVMQWAKLQTAFVE